MSIKQPQEPDYERPVAYDAEGKPLYAHPSTEHDEPELQETQTVHLARSTNPQKPIISDAIKLKHDRSERVFPGVDLSEGEYVISAIRRHPIGLFVPFTLGILLISLAFILLFNYDLVAESFQLASSAVAPSMVVILVIIFIILVTVGIYIAYFVYMNNRLFLTNESVIQEIQTGPFARSGQIVSLANIEDVSYSQNGIIQQMFNYGSIRLSTEGDETTYRFSYAANPKEYTTTLNNAVEAFKNGRLVNND